MSWITIVSSFLLVLKRKEIREPLGFQKGFWISLSFAISGMHLAIEVSYAGFAKFFVAMIMFWWMDMWKINLSDFYFWESVIYQIKGTDSQEAFPSKQNTLNSCEGVMVLFLLSCCHAMNFCIS